jgi:hypothetical protein
MSRESVDRVREALEGLEHRGPEAILELVDPEVEWIADLSDQGRVTYRGFEGVKDWIEGS